MSKYHKMDRKFFLETSIHTFTAEISELSHGGQLAGRNGLPTRFIIPGLGNGNSFAPIKIERNQDSDLMFVKYRQVLGCVEVIIFND